MAKMPSLRCPGPSAFVLAFALAAGCSSSTEPPATKVPVIETPATPNPDSALSGTIVYTLLGELYTYTPSTRAGAKHGARGVNPKFSKDGTKIVYQSTAGIVIMDANGANPRVLSATGGVPSFDPTGQFVVFGSTLTGISRIRADGTGLVQLTTDRGFQPSYSPDGTQIAYAAPVGLVLQLHIMNADGTNSHQALASNGIIDVVWGPGPKILFGLLVGEFNYELHSFDPSDAASLTRLTTATDNDFEPSWSPDGKNISWCNVTTGLWIMKADGTGGHNVVNGARQGSWGK